MRDLEAILGRCRQHDISLNPKKFVFFLEEGKFCEHIISKDDIRIDLGRVKLV